MARPIRNMPAVFNELADIRRRRSARTVRIQRVLKSGKWGKPHDTQRFGNETDQEVVDRLNRLNPGSQYRLAQ